jgi:uncharacterized cupin superfamily protein
VRKCPLPRYNVENLMVLDPEAKGAHTVRLSRAYGADEIGLNIRRVAPFSSAVPTTIS